MSNTFFVSIIIPTYDDVKQLEKCLESVSDQSYPKINYEVIVANNNPSCDLSYLSDMFANLTIVTESSPGSYAARNAALGVASGNIIAFTDSDCIPDKKWIENGVYYLKNGYSRVAGKVQLIYKGVNPTLAERYEKAFAFRQEENAADGTSVTANLFVWRSLFDQVGFFDPGLLTGGDMEWNRRATKQSVDIFYAPDVLVYHPTRSSFKELKTKKRRVGAGYAMNRHQGDPLFVIKLLWMGLMPPLYEGKKINQRSDLSFGDKAAALFVHYLLKIYGALYGAMVITNLRKPERR